VGTVCTAVGISFRQLLDIVVDYLPKEREKEDDMTEAYALHLRVDHALLRQCDRGSRNTLENCAMAAL
jgi:hypothetical protein